MGTRTHTRREPGHPRPRRKSAPPLPLPARGPEVWRPHAWPRTRAWGVSSACSVHGWGEQMQSSPLRGSRPPPPPSSRQWPQQGHHPRGAGRRGPRALSSLHASHSPRGARTPRARLRDLTPWASAGDPGDGTLPQGPSGGLPTGTASSAETPSALGAGLGWCCGILGAWGNPTRLDSRGLSPWGRSQPCGGGAGSVYKDTE